MGLYLPTHHLEYGSMHTILYGCHLYSGVLRTILPIYALANNAGVSHELQMPNHQ